VRLSEGRVGLAVRVAAMPDVPVIVTHLAANRENQRNRTRELAVLLAWTARQGPGVLIGDLNAQPDADEIAPVMTRYRDAWADAAAVGRARGVATGSTRPGRRVSRIDYVLYAPNVDLTLESVEVVDFSTLPELVMTPNAAYQYLVRDEIEHVPLDKLAERVLATSVVPYPPGIPMLMPGESTGARDGPYLGYLRALAAWDKRFPGFGHDTHGVENRDGVYYVQCLKPGAGRKSRRA
jgi:hypothetical protein